MKKLIFDTSAINALAKDPDCHAITCSLRVAYHIGITETVIAEVAAYADPDKRNLLLNVIERLLKFGMCVNPYQFIIEQQARAYQLNPTNFDWQKVGVRFIEAEREAVVREIIASVSDETRESLRQWNKDYGAIFAAAKPAFQALFNSGNGVRPSLQDVAATLLGTGGAHLAIGASLMERATGTRPSEPEARDFMERCPPFKSLLAALCFSQYDRCIRAERAPSLGKAGRVDMFSAVYLAYCRVFVTEDKGQWKALTAVAELTGREMQIQEYKDFKANLIGLNIHPP
ncbi:MAG: hypothetical protein JWN34_2300 [Bryobacterales bacterium]|nr:hypothetical protein [Bryobacterales bacterium]